MRLEPAGGAVLGDVERRREVGVEEVHLGLERKAGRRRIRKSGKDAGGDDFESSVGEGSDHSESATSSKGREMRASVQHLVAMSKELLDRIGPPISPVVVPESVLDVPEHFTRLPLDIVLVVSAAGQSEPVCGFVAHGSDDHELDARCEGVVGVESVGEDLMESIWKEDLQRRRRSAGRSSADFEPDARLREGRR